MTDRTDPVELTQHLIRFDTVNPPGHEADCALYLASLLANAGLDVAQHAFAPGRTSVVARLDGAGDQPPLAMTGHLDTVPFGAAPWSREPLGAEIDGDKLYGRGASDMKSGVAALVACATALARRGRRLDRGLVLVLTAGEETGCDGARHLATAGLLSAASGLLVAEPTSNYPAIGHRGALWIKGTASGVAAHGSMPERGVNAVYKAARAIGKLEDFGFNQQRDELLGGPSLNVGTVSGGMNVNSVPDWAEFAIDVRTVGRGGHTSVIPQLTSYLEAEDVELHPFVDLEPVKARADDPFVQTVFTVMADVLSQKIEPRALPFFTDASVLGTAMSAPAVILGPGETDLAHKTDEYCYIHRISEAVEAYTRIVDLWCGS